MRAILSRRAELRAAGQLERELVTAWRYGTEAMGIGVLHALFRSADRARLVASCDPLPPGAPYTLFRGVRGSGLPRGLSWTPSLSMARYYALLPETGSPSRRVCRTTVHEADVYFFCFCPGLEFVCDAPHEPVLLEEGREVIEANWRRDGLDP